MPHCIIEYSQELETSITPKLMINTVHQGALASGLFEESHIKSRALAYEHYKTGTSHLRFIHITARILSGRSLELKANLSQTILESFTALIQNNNLSEISVTVEVRDLERETYAKNIL